MLVIIHNQFSVFTVQHLAVPPSFIRAKQCSVVWSFDRSFAWSLDRSIVRSLDRSIARSPDGLIVRSFDRSIDRSLAHCIARSLDRSVAWSLDRSFARSRDRSITRSFDRSLVRSIARLPHRSLDRSVSESPSAPPNPSILTLRITWSWPPPQPTFFIKNSFKTIINTKGISNFFKKPIRNSWFWNIKCTCMDVWKVCFYKAANAFTILNVLTKN